MTSRQTVRIARRFQGPGQSGNGGYVAGVVGTALSAVAPAGTVPQVTLRQPPPLEVDLELLVDGQQAQLLRLDGSGAGQGQGAELMTVGAVPVPADQLADAAVDPVSPEVARAAESSYPGFDTHPFPGCFVCGPANPGGLQLRPGVVPGDRTACTWQPAADLVGADGLVDPVFLWAALDCPGAWTFSMASRPSVLGRLTACVDARPPAGEECVVMGGFLAEDGRKTHTATTVYDADGRVLARARQTWLTVDPALFN